MLRNNVGFHADGHSAVGTKVECRVIGSRAYPIVAAADPFAFANSHGITIRQLDIGATAWVADVEFAKARYRVITAVAFSASRKFRIFQYF